MTRSNATLAITRTTVVGGVTFVVDLPAEIFDGERCVSLETLERWELAIATWLVDHAIRTGASLRYVRRVLGLTPAELAALLGAETRTITSWEDGEREIDPIAFVVVGQLVHDAAIGSERTLAALRATRAPAVLPPDPIRLDLT